MRINDLNAVKTAPMAPRPAARPLLGVARSDVTWGQVFRRYDANGALSEKKYGAVGKNGRFYSFNVANGETAAADDGAVRVKVVGTWDISIKIGAKATNRITTRGRVSDNEVFKTKGGKKLYAHMARLNDGRYIALNAQSQDYALTPANRGVKNVIVLGTFDVNVKA